MHMMTFSAWKDHVTSVAIREMLNQQSGQCKQPETKMDLLSSSKVSY